MIKTIRSVPSATLLVAQLVAVLLYPLAGESHAGRALFALFGFVILALVVRTVGATPGFTWVAVGLGLPAVLLLLIQAVTGSGTLLPWSSGFEAVLYFYAAYSLIRYIAEDTEITVDELYAVGATFTLLAWAFAYTYLVCQAISPGAFGDERTWHEMLFLSFTTLTATGLSDIVPVQDFARSLNMTEQIFGLGFVAMLVSRVVALTVIGHRSPPR